MLVKIKGKLFKVERIEDGIPVIKTDRTEIVKHPDGRQDVIVHVKPIKLNSNGGN